MKNRLLAAAVAAAMTLGAAEAAGASAEELAEIRAQLQQLMQRVDRLEQENESLKAENEQLKSQDDYLKAEARGLRKEAAVASSELSKVKGSDWAGRVALKGDVRFRYEQISDDTLNSSGVPTADRYRNRVRARLAAEVKTTDTIQLGVGLATVEGGDPRSSNQTLSGVFSRKSFDLDLAYFDWKFADWGNLIGGKMKQPFFRPGQSQFWDSDINPEGLAMNVSRGAHFGTAYGYWLSEISGPETSVTSDIMLYGVQVGTRLPVGASTLTLAAHYYDLASGQGRSPFYVPPGATLSASHANGNTTCTLALCGVVAPTLAFDYQVINLSAELNMLVGERPLQLWADVAQNQDADDHDLAWAAGVLFGKAGNYRTWEVGARYQAVEKDALFAQLIDSDFANGFADNEGFVLSAGYAPVKNWVLNATYFLTQRNADVPNASGATGVDYDRLQLDFNVKF